MSTPSTNLKESFYVHFQHEVTALQSQISALTSTDLSGTDRVEATGACLAGIGKLSDEVKDASTYIPSYDQRSYADGIKALHEKLQQTRDAAAPRKKFGFKSARKSPTDSVAAADVRGRGPITNANDTHKTPSITRSEKEHDKVLEPVSITEQSSAYIKVSPPSGDATSPSALTSLDHCVIDMSANGNALTSLTARNIKDSLLLCGTVRGPLHITSISNSTIVISCHQFRMHDCVNCDVYLTCSSKPIIEDCFGIRFSKMPQMLSIDHEKLPQDLWNQVQDFKWLKAEQSPNWSILEPEFMIGEDAWRQVVSTGQDSTVDDVLKTVKVVKG